MLRVQHRTVWGRALTRAVVVSSVVLAPVGGLGADKQEVRVARASLAEVRLALFGEGGEVGLIGRGLPFEAKFVRMALSAQDVPQLMTLVTDAAQLPPRSEVKLEGAIDKARFRARVEKNRKGRLEIRLEGLIFTDHREMVALLSTLAQHGVWEAQVKGVVGGKRVEVSLER